MFPAAMTLSRAAYEGGTQCDSAMSWSPIRGGGGPRVRLAYL